MKVGPPPSRARPAASAAARWTAATSWPSTWTAGSPKPDARLATDSPAMAALIGVSTA
jgi:hypothetical protein